MKTLIVGKKGQVAWELQRSFSVNGEVRALSSEEFNLQTPNKIVQVMREYRPSVVVNAAAYTAVDKAESEESLAMQINGHSVGVLASEAKRIGIPFLHYSTDYVFDGSKSSAYVESDSTAPLNVYGKSKLLGEKLIEEVGGNSIILRVSWVYGARAANFYRTMLRLGREKEELKIVGDQVGAPTWCRHIADASARILLDPQISEKSGTFHLSPQGSVSWHGFAEKIFELYRKKHGDDSLKFRRIESIPTSAYVTPARRPLNSRMQSAKVKDYFGICLPEWNHSLELVVDESSVLS